jgi:hypothetical protein
MVSEEWERIEYFEGVPDPNDPGTVHLLPGPVQDKIGQKTVYHATNEDAGKLIVAERRMIPGIDGLFGAAIYFAETPEIAQYKCRTSAEVTIRAVVDFGTALVLTGEAGAMTFAQLNKMGCNSIKGRRSPDVPWEFVVFESDRIRIECMMSCKCQNGRPANTILWPT